jgi:hypothetical protein
MPESMITQIGNLLSRAETEYGEYTRSVQKDGAEDVWDVWLSAWLIEHRINDLMGTTIDGNDLADLLRDIKAQHARERSQQAWTDYAAQQLVETAGRAEG